MADHTGPRCDLKPQSSSGCSSQVSLPSPTELRPHCIHDNTTYSKKSSCRQSAFSVFSDESEGVHIDEWVESTIDMTTSSGTSPSISTVIHTQGPICPAVSSSSSLKDHTPLPLPLPLPLPALHFKPEGADSTDMSCVISPSPGRCGQLEGVWPVEAGGPPHSPSVFALSELSIFVPLHRSLQDSGRFRRTLRTRRCRRLCDPNRPMVTSCSIAEDNLSLSVVLSLLCLLLNPPYLLLTLPAALLAYMAGCNEKEGDLTGLYRKLNVVAALNCVVFFGGVLLPLGGTVTVVVMECLK